MGATNTGYGSRHHRPCVEHGGAPFVSCSTMASASAEENSSIADSWSIALSLSRKGKKRTFDAEMKPVECKVAHEEASEG